jgi:pyruvate formate lyase activating enzyme
MKEALLYEVLDDSRVRCHLCAHRCLIAENKLGICNVRENRDGKLYTLVYGKTISQHVDPIEKKPLYHFYPGSTAYSIATPGCNFRCQWCQNWEIAQMPREQGMITGYDSSPHDIISAVIESQCRSIAYTYTEPTIFFEYTYDIARLAQKAGIANIYVTNGYMTSEMLEMIHPYLDAANVDLKAFKDKTYKHFTGARLQPVLDSLILMKKLGIWVEITTLVVPGINDDYDELKEIAQFIAKELDIDTPWHLSRFFPHYKMSNIPLTSSKTLDKAKEIGQQAGLRYVYLGNVGGELNTICQQCGKTLIRRRGYWIPENRLINGNCPDCGSVVSGVWENR